MVRFQIILNEREAQRARALLARLRTASSAHATIATVAGGLPPEVVTQHQRSLSALEKEVTQSLKDYEEAKEGRYTELIERWHHDLGAILIVARIARGLSQSDLATKLKLREQQIQRYEAERYRSITFANFRRIAAILGVDLIPHVRPPEEVWLSALGDTETEFPKGDVDKILEYARKNCWFEMPGSVEDGRAALIRYVGAGSGIGLNHALLRTGFKSLGASDGLSLLAWKARVAHRVFGESHNNLVSFDPVDISWLSELVSLSEKRDGISQIPRYLQNKGIIFIIEQQITGLPLDGGAFVINETPTIALTLRYDRIDNFWHTLMHELAHVLLHYSRGLVSGFFDNTEYIGNDEMETEADEFAQEVLVPSMRWRVSPARISRLETAVENFAKQLGIHSAIVFGKIRKERNDYSIFSHKIGQGEVRKQLLPKKELE